MKIHEYQAKTILAKFGVPVPRGRVATNPAEAYDIARSFGGTVAVKAQIHAGGRGKGGGVKIAKSAEEAESWAAKMIGMKLVTAQTGAQGREVQRVLIEEGLDIRKEFYLSVILDRAHKQPLVMASREGGVEIEEVAATHPELIVRQHVDPALGLQPYQARKIASGLGVGASLTRPATDFLARLYRAFVETDASLVEVNPLVVTGDGKVVALDAKMDFDDNALYRQPEIREMRDYLEEDPLETQASRYGLNYIKLDGSVGCMVNGAGLAMATMDIIKISGGNPANFLDVGGGANVEQVRNAFRILVSDDHVKAVLINIFGGIMRCDTVAEGVVQACREIGVDVPVVVRLEGTNVERGRQILKDADLGFSVASGMADAAEKVCALAAG